MEVNWGSQPVARWQFYTASSYFFSPFTTDIQDKVNEKRRTSLEKINVFGSKLQKIDGVK
jgi:hypothetical protein